MLCFRKIPSIIVILTFLYLALFIFIYLLKLFILFKIDFLVLIN